MTLWDETKPLVLAGSEHGGTASTGTSSTTYYAASTNTTTTESSSDNNNNVNRQPNIITVLKQWLRALQHQFDWIEWDAVYFGVRMSICITVASFAILLRDPGDEFVPQAMWIVVTVLFVCWFPNSLDAASVVEKSIQRLYGTFLGASTGLACGFLSLLILYHHDTGATPSSTGTDDAVTWFGTVQDDQDNTYDEVVMSQNNEQPALQQPQQAISTATGTTTRYTNVAAQSAFLISCISIYTFVICWGAIQFKVRKSNAKIITKFNYACILSLLTFYISILPFYSDTVGAKWRKARWRVTNVILGCILGAGLSISVFPRSTKSIVKQKLQQQLNLAGEASQAVLHAAAEQFSETAYVLPGTTKRANANSPNNTIAMSSIIMGHKSQSIRERLSLSRRLWRRAGQGGSIADVVVQSDDEVALNKYEAAIGGWRTIKTQLNNLRYDPFHWGAPDSMALTDFKTEVNNIVARIQRIQTTVVLMDGIVKNDPKHNFSATHINRLARIGTLIRKMLDVTCTTTTTQAQAQPQLQQSTAARSSMSNHSEANTAAYTELKAELASIRHDIVELAGFVANAPQDNAQNYVGKLDKGLIGRSNLDLTSMTTSMTTTTQNGNGNGDGNTVGNPSRQPTDPTIPETVEDDLDNVDDDTHGSSWNDPFHGHVMNDYGGRGAPKHVQGSRVCALLFLQLVEHLALRSLRTFQAWKQCDTW